MKQGYWSSLGGGASMGLFHSLHIKRDGQELAVQSKCLDFGVNAHRVDECIDGARLRFEPTSTGPTYILA